MEADWTLVIHAKKVILPANIKFTGYNVKRLEERWRSAVKRFPTPGGVPSRYRMPILLISRILFQTMLGKGYD